MNHKQFMSELHQIHQNASSEPEIDHLRLNLLEDAMLDILAETDGIV